MGASELRRKLEGLRNCPRLSDLLAVSRDSSRRPLHRKMRRSWLDGKSSWRTESNPSAVCSFANEDGGAFGGVLEGIAEPCDCLAKVGHVAGGFVVFGD